MGRRRIEIDRLEIRLKGVARGAAVAAAGGLGRELMSRLASMQQAPAGRRTGDIDRLEAGTVHVASGTTSSDLSGAIAARVAERINSTSK